MNRTPMMRRLRSGDAVRLEPWPRRVRAELAGEIVADSTRVMLMFEKGHRPVYYFPREDLRMDLMKRTSTATHCPRKGNASYWTIRVGGIEAPDAVWAYESPLPHCPDISGLMAFRWGKIDHWFEEDDEIFVHPRDPYTRVDVLHSSRRVRVELHGETLAETARPRLLFETRLPTRYYIPRVDVRMDLLEPSASVTACPYKGLASYFSARVGDELIEDVAWTYPAPIPECPKIEQLICFFNERADIYVDGELQPRPRSPWS